jgi:protein-S-isoprenylcysteine O-methyltransferase Ste14
VLRYGIAAAVVFHLVVVLIEEPRLRCVRGPEYKRYLRTTHRWL